jgi:hypothetical protein
MSFTADLSRTSSRARRPRSGLTPGALQFAPANPLIEPAAAELLIHAPS